MSLGKISVTLDLDAGTFTASMQSASGAVTKFGHAAGAAQGRVTALGGSVDTLGSRVHRLIQTMGLFSGAVGVLHRATTEWMFSILKTNGEIERMTALLGGLSNAGTATERLAEAKENVAWLFDFATKAPFSVNALTDAFVKLKSGGIDNVESSMQGLVNAVAAFGGTDEQLHRASIAMQQMAGKGVISMEELRQQLGEAVPTALKTMARSMGLTVKDLVDKISKGTVEAKQALARMTQQMLRENYGAAERMMSTFDGLLKQLSTKWTLMQVEIGKAGYLDAAKDALNQLIVLLNAPVTARFAKDVGEALRDIIVFATKGVSVIAAYRAEIERAGIVIAAVWGTAKVAGMLVAVGGFYAALRNVTVAIGAFSASMGGAAIATRMVGANLVVTTTTATVATGVFSRLAVGARVLGVAMAGALGPIVAIGWALYETARYLNLFGDKYEEVKRKIRDGELSQTTAEINEMGAAYVANAKKLAELRTELAAFERAATGTDQDARIMANLRKQIQEKETFLKDAAENRRRSQEEVDNREGEAQARAALLRYAGLQSAVSAEYKLKSDALEKERIDAEDNKAKLLEINQRQAALNAKIYADLQAEVQRQANETQSALSRAVERGNGAEASGLEKTLEELIKKFNELGVAAAEAARTTAREFVYLTKEVAKLSPYEMLMKSLQDRLAGMQGQLDGTGSALAKAKLALERGDFKDMTPERIAKLLETAAAVDKLKAALSGSKAATNDQEEAFRSLSRMLDDSKEKYEDILGVLNDPSQNKESSAYLAALKNGNEALKKLTQGSADYRRGEEQLALTLKNISGAAILDYVTKLREKTETLKNGLLSEREAKEAEYKYEVEQVQRKAELWKLEGDARIKAEEELQEYLKALREKHLRDMETPIESLFRTWMDKTKAMQDASANWIRGFADGLTEFIMTGKMDFKKFADSIIRDIIRIQVQANIATVGSKLLNGLLDGMFKSSGGGNTVGTTGGSINYGGPGVGPSAFHTGGIVGKEGSLWEQAKKYHGGGMIGGRSLGSSEVPIIAKKGEGVFTAQQMKAMGGAGNIVVNVINQTSQPVNAKQGQPRIDGERMVLDVVLQAANSPGPFRDGLKGAMS